MGALSRLADFGRLAASEVITRAVNAFQIPLPTSLTSKNTIARDNRMIGQQVQRLGGNLKPRDIAAICARADTGYMQLLCDVFDDSRQREGHLANLLSRRENAIGGTPWQMIPASESKKAVRIAAFVEQALKALGSDLGPDGEDLHGLRNTLCHMGSAVGPGFACSEMLWKKVGRYTVPSGSLPMGARRFIYSVSGAELRWWDESGPLDMYPGLDLRRDFPAGRFIVHRPRITGGIGPREGFMRPLVWSSFFRSWGLGDWLRESEFAGKPYRWAEYDTKAQQEDLDLIDRALEALTTNGWTRFPIATKVHVEYAKGANAGGINIHEAICTYLASEETKLLLGATLTVEAGKTGAMALGNVHAQVARDILEVDARGIEATIMKCLVIPMVRRNFGPNAPMPEFRFLTEESTDLTALSNALDKLLARGLRIPAAWVRATFGIPEPEEGEELVGTGKAAIIGETAPVGPIADDEDKIVDQGPGNEPSEQEPDEGDSLDLQISDEEAKRLIRAFRVNAVLMATGVRQPLYGRGPITIAREWIQ